MKNNEMNMNNNEEMNMEATTASTEENQENINVTPELPEAPSTEKINVKEVNDDMDNIIYSRLKSLAEYGLAVKTSSVFVSHWYKELIVISEHGDVYSFINIDESFATDFTFTDEPSIGRCLENTGYCPITNIPVLHFKRIHNHLDQYHYDMITTDSWKIYGKIIGNIYTLVFTDMMRNKKDEPTLYALMRICNVDKHDSQLFDYPASIEALQKVLSLKSSIKKWVK